MEQLARYEDDWAAIDEAKELSEAWVFEDIGNDTFIIVSDPAEADRLANEGDWSLVWSSVGGLANV